MTEKKTNTLVTYFTESYKEIKKTSWPTSKQAVKLTVIVLSFCLASIVLIWLADYIFSLGYGELLNLSSNTL